MKSDSEIIKEIISGVETMPIGELKESLRNSANGTIACALSTSVSSIKVAREKRSLKRILNRASKLDW